MANTLTGLLPDMYEALDVISREMTGFIPAVSRNSNVERAAIGQNVLVPVTTSAASADNTPGVTAPNTGDAVVDNVQVAITKSKHVPERRRNQRPDERRYFLHHSGRSLLPGYAYAGK